MNKKSVITFYLNNLVQQTLAPRETDAVLDFIDNTSNELFGAMFSIAWGTGKRHKTMPDTESGPKVRNIETLRQALQKKPVQNILERGMDQSVDCLVDLFNLNDTERAILQFFVCVGRYPMLRALVSELLDSGRFSCRINVTDIDVISMICGLSENKVSRALAENNVLIHSGILVLDTDGELFLHKLIRRAVNMHIKDTNKMKTCLLGDKRTGNKNLNFDHVQSGYDYICALLDNAVKNNTCGMNILIYGPTGTGKTEMAKQIVGKLGYDLYSLQTSNKTRQDKNVALSYLMHAQRILYNDNQSVILLDEAEDVFRYNEYSTDATSKLMLNQILEQNVRPVIWVTNNINCMDQAYLRRFSYCMELPKPNENMKLQIWKNICKMHKLKLSPEQMQEYAKKYDVAPGIIDTAVRAEKLTGISGAIAQTIDSMCVVLTGKKPQNTTNNTNVAFDTTLLNTDVDMARLTEQIVGTGRKNFSLCLYGASGTGKSAFARHLAEQMGIKFILKRASDLKGMYVGETEKNIARAFRQAHEENAMLIFDEADSFLRDRTRANAGWEVSSVNEMLTQMESATIPFVCTTNLMADLDPASLRRFLFKIKYDFMTQSQVQIAFNKFFGMDISNSDLRELTHLTPGDFVVVKNKADILGVKSVTELIDMLRAEMLVKNVKRTLKIGFANQ